MQIYVMERNYEVLKKLESFIKGNPKNHAKYYTNAKDLIDGVRKDAPDAVLMDYDTVTSSTTARIIHRENPDTKVVIMSENKYNAADRFDLDLSGFLLKPVAEDKLKGQLFNIRHPLLAMIGWGD